MQQEMGAQGLSAPDSQNKNQQTAVAADALVAAPATAGKKEVPIVFSTDEKYAPYLAAVVQSIIDNSSESYNYILIIMDCSTSGGFPAVEEAVVNLKNMLVRKNNFSVRLIKVLEYLDEGGFIRKNKEALRLYGFGTYARILVPRLLKDYERVLYLDIDQVVLEDIASIFYFPMKDKLIAAVPDISVALCRLNAKSSARAQMVRDILGLTDKDRYIVAAPCLFNIRACREFDFTDKVLAFLQENHHLPFPDQDAINAICKNHIAYLPQKWGLMNMTGAPLIGSREFSELQENTEEFSNSQLFDSLREMAKEWESAAEEPCLIHYTGNFKPWLDADFCRSSQWWQYAAETAYYPRYLKNLTEVAYRHAVLDAGGGNGSKVYTFLGLPILSVKAKSKGKIYLVGGKWRIAKFKYGRENSYLYVFGIKLCASKNI